MPWIVQQFLCITFLELNALNILPFQLEAMQSMIGVCHRSFPLFFIILEIHECYLMNEVWPTLHVCQRCYIMPVTCVKTVLFCIAVSVVNCMESHSV